MKYLSSSTTSISIVIAVVLFAIASWIEGDRPLPEAPPPVTVPILEDAATIDSAIGDVAATQSCSEAERELAAKVEESRSCRVDDDCTIFDFGYPIQCLTSVARSEIGALRLEFGNYERSCSYRVYYDCPSEPMERHPVCRDGRCAVELRTLEMLKDQTLDHIGDAPVNDRGRAPRGRR